MWCCEDIPPTMKVATPLRPAWCLSIAVIWQWGHWEVCFVRQESTQRRSSRFSEGLSRGICSCASTAAIAAPLIRSEGVLWHEPNHTDLLVVREHRRQGTVTEPFRCLGFVSYESHAGERPMAIRWRLEREIPAVWLQGMALAV
jgi:hypothetical protein